MKRKVAFVAVAMVLGVDVCFGTALWAQGTGATQPAAQPPRTKIALINLNQVVKSYKKYLTFQDEFKKAVEQWDAQLKEVKTRMDAEAATAQAQAANMTAEQKDAATNRVKGYQRQIQDISDQAKSVLGKKEADQISILYKEIRLGVDALAKARDLELVMLYNDVPPADMDTPAAIGRRLTTTGCLPMFMAPGMDVTNDVILMMNNWYDQQAGTRSTGAAPAGH